MKNNILDAAFTITFASLFVCAFGCSANAHNVKGINYPTLATARITSPSTATDVPIPIYNTGVSVACFNVRNTSPGSAVITAVGIDLPGDYSDFSLVLPASSMFRVDSQVDLVPYYPERVVDVALLTGPRFNSDGGKDGLLPSTQFTTMCVSGQFPAGLTVENMLNYVFVRFTRVGPDGNLHDIGIWENAPLP